MRTFKHKNTGIERKLEDTSPLVSVLESSPSWEEVKESTAKKAAK